MTASPNGDAGATARVLGAVLFDLDDTLHDDAASQADGARQVAEEVRARHPEVDPDALAAAFVRHAGAFWSAFGAGALQTSMARLRASMWAAALADAGVADDGTLAAACGERYIGYRRERFELFPEAIDLLERLRARGVKTGMITNGLAETHRDKIARLKLEPLLDLVFIADEVGLVKPDPRVFALACERLGLAPQRCAMVGDRYDRDIRAPLGLGMMAIWTYVRGEIVPAGEPAPDADLPSLAGVFEALAPFLPAPPLPP